MMTNTPHDKFFNAMMTDLRIVKDFLQAHLPARVKVKLSWPTLKVLPIKFVEEDLQFRETDVLVGMESLDGQEYHYFLMEHQRNPDPRIPYRLMHGRTHVTEWHYLRKRDKRTCFVYCIVYYNGIKKLSHAIDSTHLLVKDTEQDFLLDVSALKDQELKGFHWADLINVVMRYPIHWDIELFFKEIGSRLEKLKKPEVSGRIIDIIINYFIYTTGGVDLETLHKIVMNHLPKFLQEHTMNLAEHLHEEGRQKGMQRGIQKGIQKGAEDATITIAKRLLQNKVEPEFVAVNTGLSLQHVQQLLAALND